MGFSEGEILLDSPTGAYYAGQIVNGRLVFELQKEKKIRGIHLSVHGFCSVHWSSQRSRRVNDRTEHYTVAHDSYEEYISLKVQLFGSKNAERHLKPGKFEYPFTFQLPATCPSSFEGSVGHVRYELNAVMDIPYAIDKKVFRDLRVHAPLDLNLINCKDPASFEFDQTYCCWCCTSGSSETIVKIPARGFCPGQVIPIEVSCQNRSTVEIDHISFRIKKKITYRAVNEPGEKYDSDTVVEVKKGPVPPHTDRNWTVEMSVPHLDVHNLQACSFIRLEYEFKVTVSPDGCHEDEDDSCQIFFGTVPLVGFESTVPNSQNPQSDFPTQNYPQIAAPYPQPVINQPVSVNQSHAAPNSPFPPNPYNNSPYPSPAPYPIPQNTPYSPAQHNPAPYPGGNQPYPGGNQPYPGGNQPYPGGNPPYPGGPQPHQVGNQPYPGGIQPYPGGNPPYPGGNPPYPGGNPPYPVGNAPPPVDNKPGPVGFTMEGHGNFPSIPMLPPGTVPYPVASPKESSPFTGASAPNVTPDNENKKTFESSETSNSPYNPEFMADKKEPATDSK